ncbi:Leucine-rich repeat-containing protein 34 [Bagarius yarrelli]|uniref:Leucine-rich repeat-containing protein 34 n=1 Tax=Bagarius yarrelli TaxID=175774 RepID=A0A556VXB5_BAGYA|nr:Leucine-rich repeat-containing protein 34 [Bagarius yarrelli]
MCNNIEADGAKRIAKSLHHNTSLKRLRMTGNKIGNKGAMHFASMLQINSTLEELDVSDCDLDTQNLITFAIVLTNNRSLVSVNVSRPLLFSLQEETTVHMARMLQVNHSLKELHMGKHGMTNCGLQDLCEALISNHSLRYLDLHCNRITRDGTRHLAVLLQHNDTLQILDLSFNRIEDDGAVRLSDAIALKHTKLRALSIQNNSVSTVGLLSLSKAITANPHLTHIYIWGNRLEEPAFSQLITSSRLSAQHTDVTPYEVDGRLHLAEASHGLQRNYYWTPSYSEDGGIGSQRTQCRRSHPNQPERHHLLHQPQDLTTGTASGEESHQPDPDAPEGSDALTRARVPTLTPRPSLPPCSPGKDTPTKTESTTPSSPSAPPKAPPVRHLTVPPPSKPECSIPSPQNPNICPQLVQLSPSRQNWTSPQRASPPSPVLPPVSTSSPAPPRSPLTSITHTTDTAKELKSAKIKTKPGHTAEEIPQDLKCPSSQTKPCGRKPKLTELHISSLSSDLSPLLSSMIQPSVHLPASRSSPTKLLSVPERAPAQQSSSSHTGLTEPSKPIILTSPGGRIHHTGRTGTFPVNSSSLMVGPRWDAVGVGHKLVLQCHFCKRKGTAQTFNRSKRFCSKSCAKRFSYTKRFRALRRCVSEGGHRSEFNGAEDEIEDDNFQQVKHSTTEQWRILQRPLQEGEDEATVPMKTRLRRHTEQSVRETRSSETKSAPTSPLDVVSPSDLTSHSKPAQWTVDQVWSFISNLPGCQDIAESFRAQEIDGQALLLLTEDHLMTLHPDVSRSHGVCVFSWVSQRVLLALLATPCVRRETRAMDQADPCSVRGILALVMSHHEDGLLSFGFSLYAGWMGSGLCLLGGSVLTCCSGSDGGPAQRHEKSFYYCKQHGTTDTIQNSNQHANQNTNQHAKSAHV